MVKYYVEFTWHGMAWHGVAIGTLFNLWKAVNKSQYAM